MGNGGQEKINDTNKGKKYGKSMGKRMAKFGKIENMGKLTGQTKR